jgi:hypothetical protein
VPSTTAPDPDWRLAVVFLLLVIIAASILRFADLGVDRDHITAAALAVLQLAVVATVIATVMESLWWSLAFVLLMLVVATGTSHQRIGATPSVAVDRPGHSRGCASHRACPRTKVPTRRRCLWTSLPRGRPPRCPTDRAGSTHRTVAAQTDTSALPLPLMAARRVVRRDLCGVLPR